MDQLSPLTVNPRAWEADMTMTELLHTPVHQPPRNTPVGACSKKMLQMLSNTQAGFAGGVM